MIRKLFAVLALVLIALSLAAAGGFYYLRTGLAPTEGAVALPGLGAPATIRRDGAGVAYVNAASAADGWYAMGFAHAQDRLWQMDFQRRIGAGRLSEVMGPASLAYDRYMRTLGLYRVAERNLQALGSETRNALESYAAGVNAYLKQRRGPLPPEFLLLRYEPEAWRPVDSLVWGRVMALQLADNMRQELLRARLSRKLSPQQMADLYPTTVRREQPTTVAAADLDRLWAALPHDLLGTGASNEWAVDGQRSATGKPVLANDPHLRFIMPNLWYLARLTTPEMSLAGATVPGIPFFILGHNDRIAWGMTTTHGDTQDLFVERADPADPGRYLTPDGPRAFMRREETILVRGEAPATLVIRETRHGPVVSDIVSGTAGVTSGGDVVALSFAALSGDDRTAEALRQLNQATDWTSFLAALGHFHSPLQNFTYADVDGNIGFAVAGRVPQRRSGDGRLPAPGWAGTHEWTGWVPFDQLPRAFNPPSGVIVNANNKPGPDAMVAALGSDWDSTYRARRIQDLLAIEPKLTVESAAAMQNDTLSLPARDLLGILTQVEPHDDRGRRAVALLKSWDGRMDRRRPEPLIFSAWLRELNRLLYADELGPLFADYWDLRPDVVELMLTQRRQWCDDVTTPGVETCEGRVAAALERALDWIAARQGGSPAGWRWGDAHAARLPHPVLGKVWPVNRWANLTIPADGDNYTLGRAGGAIGDESDPFGAIHGANYRAIYDLSDLDNSRFIQASGQSGHILSPHYGDMLRRWREGRMIRIPVDPAPAPKEKIAVLKLVPASSAPSAKP
ncbi:MAG: penicillin acylase family protein [Alphaproteobacteria bacterium]|nr:penicillin acylase family protein [Alphaproteobacteria bacterium]